MTIGPAPMIKMLLMSVLFGIFHHLLESIEQISDVARARASLRMPLKTKRRSVSARQSLQRPVEQRNMRCAKVGGDGLGIHREAVVLAGDDDLAGVQVLHRVVGAVMAELHLHGLRARSEAHQLVAQADAE